MMHVYPVNEEDRHELEGTMCPCEPKVLWEDPKTGQVLNEAVVVHKSWNGREHFEPDYQP